jgi:hypothetical protein
MSMLVESAKQLPANDSLTASLRKAVVVDLLFLSAHGN